MQNVITGNNESALCVLFGAATTCSAKTADKRSFLLLPGLDRRSARHGLSMFGSRAPSMCSEAGPLQGCEPNLTKNGYCHVSTWPKLNKCLTPTETRKQEKHHS
jgi:hypothetical protein